MKDDKILKVSEKVQWIGVLDPDIVTFDIVMETKYGTTYNSYFINAQKKTIVETTKEKFWDTYLSKIQQVVNPSEIEYIILNHTEPDHSGNARRLLEIAPHAKIVGSGNAIRYMADLIGPVFPHIIVKDGDELDLGDCKLKFIAAPNLHWPDSMYTWLESDGVLFTCDSFGAHYCHPDMYDDVVGDYSDAFQYYFDVILKPFSKFMLKAIEKIEHLPIKAIATGHGPLLLTRWKEAIEKSRTSAMNYLQKPEKTTAFVAYVSAYGKTAMLANAIGKGIKNAGVEEVIVADIENMPLGEIDSHLSKASGIVVGSPVINQNILLPIYKLFACISPLRDKGKIAGSFGSYGWSGENEKIIGNALNGLKLKHTGEGIFTKFTPDPIALEKAIQYGEEIGKEIMNFVNIQNN